MAKRGTRPSRAAAGHFRRRGSIYLLVLAVGTVLTLIGLAMISVSRAGARSLGQSTDCSQAQLLASSAVEHAIATITADTNWRADYNGVTVTQNLGQGTISWQAVDPVNGSLTKVTGAPFTINGTGTVGNSSYTIQVGMTNTSAPVNCGIVTPAGITVGDYTNVESFNSTNGITLSWGWNWNSNYGWWQGWVPSYSSKGSSAVMATNSIAAAIIALQSYCTVNGSLNFGPKGSSNAVSMASSCTLTGTSTALQQLLDTSAPAAPSGMPSDTGAQSYTSSRTYTISTNQHWDSLTISNNAGIQISGNVTILVEGNVTLNVSDTTGPCIEVLPNSSLTLYHKGSLLIENCSANIVDGQNLSRLMFINLGANPVTCQDYTVTMGVIYSPCAPVTYKGWCHHFGVCVCGSATMCNYAQFHQDLRITNQTNPVSVSVPLKPSTWVRSVQ